MSIDVFEKLVAAGLVPGQVIGYYIQPFEEKSKGGIITVAARKGDERDMSSCAAFVCAGCSAHFTDTSGKVLDDPKFMYPFPPGSILYVRKSREWRHPSVLCKLSMFTASMVLNSIDLNDDPYMLAVAGTALVDSGETLDECVKRMKRNG